MPEVHDVVRGSAEVDDDDDDALLIEDNIAGTGRPAPSPSGADVAPSEFTGCMGKQASVMQFLNTLFSNYPSRANRDAILVIDPFRLSGDELQVTPGRAAPHTQII